MLESKHIGIRTFVITFEDEAGLQGTADLELTISAEEETEVEVVVPTTSSETDVSTTSTTAVNCTDYETSEDEELIEACELLAEYDLLEEEITIEDIEAALEEFEEEEDKGGNGGGRGSSEEDFGDEDFDEESGGRGDRGGKSGHSEDGDQGEKDDRGDAIEEARTTDASNTGDSNYESNNSASISIGFVQTAIPYNNFYGIRAKLLKSDENTLAAYGGAISTPTHPEVSMFGKFAIEFNRPINYPIRVVKEYMKDYREVIPKVEPSA